MENAELGLGQRIGKDILNTSWTDEEVKLVEDAGLTLDEVIKQWVIVQNDSTLNTAISGALDWKAQGGDQRSRPFQTQAEADAEVHADVMSHDMSGKPEHVSDLITPPPAQE